MLAFQIAVDAYMIDFRTKLDRTWKPVPNTLISTKDSIIVSYTVANLEPFLYYQVDNIIVIAYVTVSVEEHISLSFPITSFHLCNSIAALNK